MYVGPFTLGKQYGITAFELKDGLAHWYLHNILNISQFKPDMADQNGSQ
jgi:hypothetical protein